MKRLLLLLLLIPTCLLAQDSIAENPQTAAIYTLIAQYAEARETRDSVLLDRILATELDQLVSSGVWRYGKETAVVGMMQSSQSNPGSRRLIVEQVRFLTPTCAIADARYEIHNPDETVRKMWSTFLAVYEEEMWRITAIRNMLPAGQP